MCSVNRFEYVTEIAMQTDRMTIKETAQFHYFNPNGLYAQKKALDARISELVDDKKLKSGWILAHGSLDCFAADNLARIAMMKRPVRSSLRIALFMLEEAINRGNAALEKEGF